jgi:branched-chain amino acid transport system substrate-binding protein
MRSHAGNARTVRWLMWLAIACAATPLVAACGSTSSSSGGSGSSGGSTASAASSSSGKGPIVVGIVTTQSGALSVFGHEIVPAIQLAVNQINSSGGVNGRQIKLVTADDMGTTGGAVAAVQRVLAQHPVALMGEILSQLVPPMYPQVAAAKVPMLFGGSADSLAANVAGGSPWYFKVTVDNDSVTRAEFAYAKQHFNLKRTGIVVTDDNIGHTWANDVVAGLKANGLPAPATIQYNCTTCTDYSSQVEKLKAAKVTAVFVTSDAPETAGYMKDASQLGLSVPTLYGQAATYATFFDHLVPATNMDGNISAVDAVPSTTSPTPSVKAFSVAYKKIAGEDATEIVPEWYAATFWLANAIKTAGSTDGTALAAALTKTQNLSSYGSTQFPGIVFSCTPNHICNQHVYLVTGKNGQMTTVGAYGG